MSHKETMPHLSAPQRILNEKPEDLLNVWGSALKWAMGSPLKAEAVLQDGSGPLPSHNTCYLRGHKSCESVKSLSRV